MSSKERRISPRYRVQAPVVFQFADSDGLVVHGAGFVKDIGTAGAFIWSRSEVPQGAALEVEVLMPQLNQVTLALRSSGRVVRTESDSGFAVAAEFGFNRVA